MQIVLWRTLAIIALALGMVGIFLPVVPTVPFVIVAAWAASKGWPALERRLLEHQDFGPYIRRWRERGAVPRKAKWLATVMLSISAVGIQFLALPSWLQLGVPAVMLIVLIWLWRRPEY